MEFNWSLLGLYAKCAVKTSGRRNIACLKALSVEAVPLTHNNKRLVLCREGIRVAK
jgi:hypothetical protein